MIAQVPNFSSADSSRIVVWSMVLIVMLVLGFVAVAKAKRRLREDDVDKNPVASAGFTLADLRQMHRDGVLSDEELEKAKAKIVQAARKSPAPAAPGPAGDIIELQAVAQQVCPDCKNANQADAAYCAHCGHDLSQQAEE